MNYHPNVLAAHAEFGGDLQAMQALYDRPDHIARIVALEARLAARTGAVKVKALEWTKLSTGWISHTSFHAYEVVATANGFMATYANLDFAWGEEETLKLAAQSDYERRILSALEDHPRATNTVDAHETANVRDKPEGQQEPVAWLYDWTDEYGTTQTSADTHKIASVNCKPARNYRPLFTRPQNRR